MVNRQRVGEGVVWKKEKATKWEMPSSSHTGKSKHPSFPLSRFSRNQTSQEAAASIGSKFGEEHLNAPSSTVYPTQPTLGDPTDIPVFYDLLSLQSRSINGANQAE